MRTVETTTCPECGADHPATLALEYPADAAFSGLARCAECDLVSLVPIQTEAEVAALYTNDASWSWFSPGEASVPARRRCASIEGSLGSTGSVFDVGADAGAFLTEMNANGWSVGGLGPSQEAATAIEARLGGHIDVGLFGPDSVPSRSWDVVTCWDVLEHMQNPAACLAAMIRYVRVGGQVVFAVPHIDGGPAKLLGSRWRYLMAPYHVHFFSLDWIARHAAANGAEVVKIDGFAKVHAWMQAALPRSARGGFGKILPSQHAADAQARPTVAARARKNVRKAVRHAILAVNQTPVPLPAADLIEVTLRRVR